MKCWVKDNFIRCHEGKRMRWDTLEEAAKVSIARGYKTSAPRPFYVKKSGALPADVQELIARALDGKY
jgi:hypothetical protein